MTRVFRSVKNMASLPFVTPANAGVQEPGFWIPASAGMTASRTAARFYAFADAAPSRGM